MQNTVYVPKYWLEQCEHMIAQSTVDSQDFYAFVNELKLNK